MPELIDRDALIQNYCGACANKEFCAEESCPYYEIRRRIEAAPTIEAEPVRHGRWILLPNRTAPSKLFRCSECENVTEHKHFSRNGYYSYCKDCGARMDGGADRRCK